MSTISIHGLWGARALLSLLHFTALTLILSAPGHRGGGPHRDGLPLRSVVINFGLIELGIIWVNTIYLCS